MFRNTVERHGDRHALSALISENRSDSDQKWKVWTWKDYWQDAVNFAKALKFSKVKNFNTINILGFNSPCWFIANAGSMLASCIPAGIYYTNSADQCNFITSHSKPAVLCIDSNEQLEKYISYPLKDHVSPKR